MKRRDFIKLLVGTGLASHLAPLWLKAAEFADAPFGGNLLLFMHAFGGWDPIQFCDPKGDPNRGFSDGEIETTGGVRYAPMRWMDVEGSGLSYEYAADFFPLFHRRMMVVQGIDMQTNAHIPGTSNAFNGTFSTGFPTLAAAYCAARAPSLLLSYLVTGDYRSTGNLIRYTALNDGAQLGTVSRPNVAENLPNNISPYRMPNEVFDIIDATQAARVNRKLSDSALMPRRRRMLQYFSAAVSGSNGLERLGAILPPEGFASLDERLRRNEFVEQIDLALHAMAAGVTAAVDVKTPRGTFDSHADHVRRQGQSLAELVYGLRFLWRRAEEIDARVGSNITDRLTVVIHSEFGRTPHFNADGGTDHWPTTSAIIMRKDFETTGIGSRTVGYSTNDGRYQPGCINPVTLEPDESGIELTSAHLHKALREYLGIADSPVLARFGFPGVESVNMFTPGLATPQT